MAILLIATIGINNQANATHGMGADLTYECVGPNEYRIQLQFFRDCNGIAPEPDYPITAVSTSCGSDLIFWLNQLGEPEVITPLCPGEQDICEGPGGMYGVEQYTYTGLITLPECAPGGNDWQLAWELCCRNLAITTLTISDTQEFYVTANLDNTVPDCNNSPVFLNAPTPFTCVAQEVFYNHGATDADGDSLVFSLVNCQRAGGEEVNYELGFSGTTPLSTVSGVSIDPETGAISFTPDAIQVGVLCVQVDEYRNDVLIGTVVRDIQFTIINCVNTLPAATDINGLCNDGGAVFEIAACAGANREFCFDIQACDDDGDDIITMEWNEAIPNATFTVNNTAEPVGTFCWTPTLDDLGTHSFTVQVADDACPLLGTNTYTYTVEIVDNPNEPVDVGMDASICAGESTTLTATSAATNIDSYSWSPTTGLSNPNAATTEATPTSTTVYTVTTLFTDGCEATNEVTVSVLSPPSILIFPNEVTGCPGANGLFFAGVPPDADVVWYDEGGEEVGTGSPFTTPEIDESTIFTAIVTDANGCTNTATSILNVGAVETAVCTNIYVTQDADDTGDGSQDDPTNIDNAMDMAMCNNTVIKMAAGTYNIDAPLQLSSYLTLEGGFDATTWEKSSTAGATTIHRTILNPQGLPDARRLVALQASNAVGFRLQDLTITTANALISNQEGISTYGIHLLNCSEYDIIRCQVLPGNASDGADGIDGIAGINGENGGNPEDDGNPQTGGLGGGNGGDGGLGGETGPATVGNPGQPGGDGGATGGQGGALGDSFFGFRICKCASNTPDCGDPGNDGANGTAGANGADGVLPNVLSGFLIPGSVGENGEDGIIAGGGGGGGGVAGSAASRGGGGGGGGGGGTGGSGGTGGYGGGNSVGIFITANGMNGNIDAAFIQAGNIGQGGSGGSGGSSGSGGSGGMGLDDGAGFTLCNSNESIGGDGGNGGQGGNGGNGAPGESHDIYFDFGEPLNNQTTNFDLEAQPTITSANINCTNLDVGFDGDNAPWSFAPNTLASGPNPISGMSTTAAFSNTGRYDVTNGTQTYVGFHNIALDGQANPDILTGAPMVGVDTFQLCVGESASFSTDILADEYHWNFNGAIPNPDLTTANIDFETFNTPSGSTPFEIDLFVTTDCCGDSPTRKIYLWVDEIPAGPITGENTLCEGERTTLTLTATDPDAIITWTPTGSLSTISSTQIDVFPTTTTTYIATITNERNACPKTIEHTVTVNENPDLTTTSTDAICGDDGTASVTVSNGSGNFAYAWSHDNTLNAATAPNLDFGMYTVTVTDQVTGCMDTEMVTVAPGNAPVIVVQNNTAISCTDAADGTLELGVNGGTEPFNFVWDNGLPNGATQTNLTSGIMYCVTMTDANSCEANFCYETIDPPLVDIQIQDFLAPACPDDPTGFIDANTSGGTGSLTYEWSTGENTDIITDLVSGIYTVTVTDDNSCTATASIDLTAPNLLTIALDSTDVLCMGDASGEINLTLTGGAMPFTFDWDNDGIGDNDDTQNLSGITAGTYTVTVTDANSCTVTASTQINEPTEVLTATSTPTNILCFGTENGQIDLTVENGTEPYTFDWDNDGTGDTDDTEDLTALAAGIYNVTITDANGCTETSTAEITAPTQDIEANSVPTNITCFGGTNGTIDLTIINGVEPYTFDWDNDGTGDNDDTEDLTDLAEGTYGVTITDANGCTAASSATIIAPTEDIIVDSTPTNITCLGETNGEINLTITNGATPYVFDWDNDGTGDNDDDQNLTDLAEGTYNVTVTDANGCTQTATAEITAPTESITLTNEPTNVSCFGGNDGEIDLTITNGVEPYIFDWDNDGTGDDDDTEDLTNLAEGTYNVTVTDANGCTQTSTATITAPTEDITIASTITDATCFEGDNGEINITPTGGATPYTYNWNNGNDTDNPTMLTADDYSVTVTDANGCTAESLFTVGHPSQVVLAITQTLEPTCTGNGEDGSITVSTTGGTADYTYAWSHDPALTTTTADNLTGGTYTITVTDANSCTATNTATLQNINPPTITATTTDASCEGADGTATAEVTNGTMPYTFLWNDPNAQATDIATGLDAGDYTITVTDDNGCTTTATATVNGVTNTLTASNTATNISCFGESNGEIDLLIENGTAPYTFDWDNDGTGDDDDTEDLTDLAAGTYSVTITDANGCTQTSAVTITAPTEGITASNTMTDVSCFGENNGVIDLLVENGTAPYTFDWDNDGTGDDDDTEDLTDLAAGTYSVTITDANGCTQTSAATITAPTEGITASNTTTDVFCFGENNGEIDLLVENGTAPYTFDWDNDGTGDDDDTEDLTDLAAGTYSVTITDANGCTQTSAATITAPTEGITASNTTTNISCFGENNGEIDLLVENGTAPYTFDWDNDGTGDDDDTEDLTDLAAGTYSVTITDANGCTQTSAATIDAPTESINAITFPVDVSCFGGNDGEIDLVVENGTVPYTFDWDNDGIGDNDDEQNLNNLAEGMYNVTVTDATGCTQTASANVTAPTEGIIATTTATNVNCFGGTNGTINLNVENGTAPYTFDWDNDGTGDDDDTEDLTDLPAGDYNVTITDTNGCTQTATASITQPDEVVIGIDQALDPTCTGNGNDGTITVSTTGGTADYTYTWSHDTTLDQATATDLPGGIYNITTTDANGCTATAEATLTDVEIPTVMVSTIAASCGNADGSAIASPMGGTMPYAYLWDDTNAQTTDVASTLSAGTYTVTVTDANGCTATATASVSDSDAPTATATATNSTCGTANGTATVEATGGTTPYFYEWNDTNTQTTATATDLVAGTYNVTVTDVNGCTVVANTEVMDEGAANVLATATDASCTGADGTASAGVMGGAMPYTFLWDDPNGQITQTATGLDAGTYTVTVTDANDCAVTATATVGAPVNSLTANTEAMSVSCFGGNDGEINLTVENGAIPYTFDWDNDGTGDNDDDEDLSNLSAGNYTVIITDANGCSQTASAEITEPTAVELNIDQSTNPTCAGNGTDGTITVAATGGTADYTYAWSHDAVLTDAAASDLSGGIYTITVTDANDCSTTASATLQNVSTPNVTASGVDASCGASDGSAIATASDGMPPYDFLWNDAAAQTTETANNLPAGSYTVTVTDAAGCTATATANVNDSGAPTATVTGTDATCGNSNGTASATATGGTTPYTFQWDDTNTQTTATAPNLPSGNYNVTVTDANNCLTVENITIGDSDVPTATATSTDSAAGSLDGTATVTAVGGTPPYDYLWNDNAMQITATATDLPAGNFTVTVTDANGCTVTANVTVNESGSTLATITSTEDATCGESNGSATAMPTGGAMPYTFQWNDTNMQTTPSAIGLSAGIYIVTVTDAIGTAVTAEANVLDLGTPIAATISTDATCGAADGTATAAATGGAVPYTFQWDDTNMQTTATATNLPSGNYNVTVTDANNCSVIDNVNILDSGGPTAVTTFVDALCGASNGSATVIAGGGTIPYVYQWNDTNTQTTQTASNLPSGTYNVTVTDANTCSVIETVTVGNIAGPSVIVTGTPSGCGANNGTAAATTTDGTPPYTYLWDNGDMTDNTTNLSPGIQSVTVTDANNCTATGSVNIEDVGAPMSTVSSTPSDCGGSTGTATATTTGGTLPYDYLWSDGQMTATATDLSAGAYDVTITDAGNCVEVIDILIENPNGPSATISATVAACGASNATATVTPSGGTPPYIFQWNDANTQTTATAIDLPSGNYTVTVTDASTCATAISVAIEDSPSDIVITVDIVIDAGCDAATNGSASVTATGGTIVNLHDYVWSTIPPQNNPVAQNLAPGMYTVTATDDLGCSATADVEIGSTIMITTNETINPISCFGANDGWINLLLTGGANPYTAVWSNGFTGTNNMNLGAGDYTVTITDNDGCSIVETFTIDAPPPTVISNIVQITGSNCTSNDGSIEVSATGGTTPYIYNWSHDIGLDAPTANNLAGGDYSVTIIDAQGCEAIEDASVPTIGGVDISVVEISGVLCIGDNNGIATATGSNGTTPYTYTWENSAATGDTANDLPAGTNGVTITDAAGCSSATSVEITAANAITVTATGTATDCNSGGTVTATATGGTAPYVYTWSDGIGTGDVVNDVDFGTYEVTVTDANACTATASTTLVPPTSIEMTLTGVPTSCFNTSDGQATANIAGGTAPYIFMWDNGETTNPAIALASGTQTLTVTDASGCEAIAEIEIDSPLPIVPQTAITTPVSCVGENDGTASVTASGGTGDYAYTWSNGMTGETISDLVAGVYTVDITDGAGCTLSVNLTVVEPLDGIDIEMEFIEPSCGGYNDGAATAVPEGGTASYSYEWSTGDTGQTAFGLTAGIYTVTVTDANGCTATQSVDFSEPNSVAIAYDSQDVVCFGDETGGIEVLTATGGVAPYVYALDSENFATTMSFNGLAAGSYELSVQDANGCISSETIIINSEFELLADLGADITLQLGDSTELFVQTNSTDSVSYTWLPSDGLSCSDCPNPVVNTFQSMTYQVQVTNSEGCTATDNITVDVDLNRNVFIPNIFSPDNDGANDRFIIHGGQGVVGVKTFKIFDRWGELIWERNNFNTDDPEQGWDGTFRGQNVNPGAFIYFAEVEFIDGASIVYQGDVTIVR